MHTVSEMGTSVPAFLGKLWRLVEDPETDDLICWAPNGRSFFIRNQAQFARELLPHYYKHNNMASFVRQLNMYGFHKKVSVELGGLKCDRDEMEFAHQYFCKDHPYLLDHIKRKIASNKSQDPSQQPIKPELMNRMLTEVRCMRGRQEHFDSRLGVMKRENEALWRELALLRQKHHKQQQIVNKLIHFLASLVSNRNSGLSMKRRYPLMIDDASRQKVKQPKMSKVHQSPTGPAIHELDGSDADLDSDYIVAEMLDNDEPPTIESPEHSTVDENMKEYYVDEDMQLPQEVEVCQNTNVPRKRVKGKKKGRKSKVPIKILIPTSENGEETREETFLLEVPTNKVQVLPARTTRLVPSADLTVSSDNNKTAPVTKPVPLATVRSSKLAAMAANMKRSQDDELDLDLDSLEESVDESEPKDDSLIKLENILIVPDINEDYSPEADDPTGSTMPSSVSSLSSAGACSNSPGSSGLAGDASPETVTDMGNGSFGKIEYLNDVPLTTTTSSNNNLQQQQQQQQQLQSEQHQQQRLSSEALRPQRETKNMSLSRVNQDSLTESNYREEVDDHLDTVQSDLENLREMLRSDGLSIDANTLLGLFENEDPMMSFGIPCNPDLNPHINQEREIDDDHHLHEPSGLNTKGELMTYNTGSGLLDFDDDIFLGGSSASPATVLADVTNGTLTNDSLEIVDNKGNIFDSLISNNTSQT